MKTSQRLRFIATLFGVSLLAALQNTVDYPGYAEARLAMRNTARRRQTPDRLSLLRRFRAAAATQLIERS
jgi:hypothetical protein